MFLSDGELSGGQLFLTGAALGVSAHLTYFIHGERNNSSVRIFRSITGGAFFVFVLALTTNKTIFKGLLRGLIPNFGFLIGLTSSIIVYRLFFHRLRKFPGPRIDAISKCPAAGYAYSTGHYFKRLQELHDTYGDYVRTGPTELSVNSVAAAGAIYGFGSKCTRGPASDFRGPQLSLHRTRNPRLHDEQKKFWERGLNPKEHYRNYINHQVSLFMSRLDLRHGPIYLKNALDLYAFNTMAHTTFSVSYEGVREEEAIDILRCLHNAQNPLGVISHVPWAYSIALSLPKWFTGLTAPAEFAKAALNMLQERQVKQPEFPDLTSFLLHSQNSLPRFSLDEESRLSVVAGSVNTSTVSLVTVYYLIKYSRYQAALYKELFDSGKFDMGLSTPLLDACIYEAMRLQAVVPHGGERNTPPEGLQIGEHWIPGGVIIRVPMYTMFRDPRNFERPAEFIPERWTTRPNLVKDPAAFIPFSIGKYACPGKQLGMMEIRAAVAQLVTRYHMRPSKQTDMENWENSGEDAFTMVFTDLWVELEKR